MRYQFSSIFIVFIAIYATNCQTKSPPTITEKNNELNLALEAIFGMGLRLQVLQDTAETRNFVVSPLSSTLLIAQLMLGAEGTFRDDLYNLLSLPYSPPTTYFSKNNRTSFEFPYANFHLQLASLSKMLQKRKENEHFKLLQSNALFYNQNIELQSMFTYFMKTFYNTEIRPLDFFKDTKSTINEWVDQHTNGLILNLLKENPRPETSGLFMNSIYFLGEWRTPFSDELNDVDLFYTNENTTVNTTYMQGMLEDVKFIENNNYRLLCLPYKNDELGMYIMYPKQNTSTKYNIRKFVEELDPQEVFASVLKMKYHDVIIKIPKLSLSNTLDILQPLRKYAAFRKMEREKGKNLTTTNHTTNPIDVLREKIDLYRNFSEPIENDIYLTSASKNEPFKVSDIVQNTVFSINEKGTEAAAVTSGITDYMGGSKTVILNRPFTFFVRHEVSLVTLFWGTISDPSLN